MSATIEAIAGADAPLLRADRLSVHFIARQPWPVRLLGSREQRAVRAVNDVSFTVGRGRTLGIVGESGCGKSTLARCLAGLLAPSAGTFSYEGKKLDPTSKNIAARKGRIQMIFQDPYSSLNPRWRVERIIGDPLLAFGLVSSKAEMREAVAGLLQEVGLSRDDARSYPHEFSGGQRQRIAIARALVVEPDFVICDEPISALDVSIQGQIINLLKELKQRIGLTYLFIAHDLSMVKYISDRVGVMYLGRLVEVAPKEALFARPKHPYTQALLSSVPVPDPKRERARIELTPKGELPSPMEKISGCAFRTRCPHAKASCAEMHPQLTEAEPGHFVMCTLHGTPSGA